MVYSINLFPNSHIQKLCVFLVIHWTALSGGNSLTERRIIHATNGKQSPEFNFISESARSEETRKKSQIQNSPAKTNSMKESTGKESHHYAPTQYDFHTESSFLTDLHKHHMRSKRQLPQEVVFLDPNVNRTELVLDIFKPLNQMTSSRSENQPQQQGKNITPQGSILSIDKIPAVINSDSRQQLQQQNNSVVNVSPIMSRQLNFVNNMGGIIPDNPFRGAQIHLISNVASVGFGNQVRPSGVRNTVNTANRGLNQHPSSLNFNLLNRPGTSSQHAPRQEQTSTNGRFTNIDPVTFQRNTVDRRMFPSNQPTHRSRSIQSDPHLNTFQGRFMLGFEFGTRLLTQQLQQTSTSFDNSPTSRESTGTINGFGNSMNNFPGLSTGTVNGFGNSMNNFPGLSTGTVNGFGNSMNNFPGLSTGTVNGFGNSMNNFPGLSTGTVNGFGNSMNNFPGLNFGIGVPFQQRSVQGFF